MEKVVQLNHPTSQNSALAKKIMSDLLFDHYDLGTQDYKEGWSDKRIADESGLSEVFVAQRRSQDYGPIVPPKPSPTMVASAALNHVVVLMKDLSSRANAIKIESEKILKIAEDALDGMTVPLGQKKAGAEK